MTDRMAATTAHNREPERRPAADPSRFFRRWLGFVTLGEGAGFAMAAAAGVASAVLQPSPAWPRRGYRCRGDRGRLLGVGQLLALRALRLESSVLRRWPVLTSLGAVVAWAIGLVPSTLPDLDWSNPLYLGGGRLAGVGPAGRHPLGATDPPSTNGPASVALAAGQHPGLAAGYRLDPGGLAAGGLEHADPSAPGSCMWSPEC